MRELLVGGAVGFDAKKGTLHAIWGCRGAGKASLLERIRSIRGTIPMPSDLKIAALQRNVRHGAGRRAYTVRPPAANIIARCRQPEIQMPAFHDIDLSLLQTSNLAATRAREIAQQRIVATFRDQLEGEGEGPSDDDLHVFASLVQLERSLQRRLARAVLPGLSARA